MLFWWYICVQYIISPGPESRPSSSHWAHRGSVSPLRPVEGDIPYRQVRSSFMLHAALSTRAEHPAFIQNLLILSSHHQDWGPHSPLPPLFLHLQVPGFSLHTHCTLQCPGSSSALSQPSSALKGAFSLCGPLDPARPFVRIQTLLLLCHQLWSHCLKQPSLCLIVCSALWNCTPQIRTPLRCQTMQSSHLPCPTPDTWMDMPHLCLDLISDFSICLDTVIFLLSPLLLTLTYSPTSIHFQEVQLWTVSEHFFQNPKGPNANVRVYPHHTECTHCAFFTLIRQILRHSGEWSSLQNAPKTPNLNRKNKIWGDNG